MSADERDPPRWSGQSAAGIEARMGAAMRAAAGLPAPSDTALDRVARAALRPERRPRRRRWPIPAAAGLVFAMGGVVGATTQGLKLWSRSTPSEIVTVPAGSSATVERPHRRRLRLVGPLSLEPGAADTSRLAGEGSLHAEAGDEALAIATGDVKIVLPAGSAAEIEAPKQAGVPAVRGLRGTIEVQPAGGASPVSLGAGASWPAPASVVAPPPVRASANSTASAAAATPATPAVDSKVIAAPAPKVHAEPPTSGDSHGPPRLALVDRPPPSPTLRARGSTPGEAELLAIAFRKLGPEHDPEAALARLDEHARRFPAGALTVEADVARSGALLALERNQEVLPILDRLLAGERALPRARARSLRATRATLLARVGRCREALADLDAVLADAATDEAGEQALWERAGCRARGADPSAAVADLRTYLARFPTGRFVEQARRSLANLSAR